MQGDIAHKTLTIRLNYETDYITYINIFYVTLQFIVLKLISK